MEKSKAHSSFQPSSLLKKALLGNAAFFAAVLTVTATRRRIRLWAAGTITAMDVAWVLGTAALLIGRPETFNTAGTVAAVVVALVVADFAFLQFLGIRRVMRADAGETAEPVAPLSPARAS